MSYDGFRKELTKLINRESIDSRVGCPDYVLADFLCGCAISFKVAIAQNTPDSKWYPAYNEPAQDPTCLGCAKDPCKGPPCLGY